MFNLKGNKAFLSFLLIIASSFAGVRAQDGVDYAVHANIIYHFTKYIDWPAAAKTGEFTIGIVGETPVYLQLKKVIEGKKVGQQAILLKKFPASASVFNCQILFISDDVAGKFKKIVTNTLNAPLLLVSESEGLAKKGSCINFLVANNKLKLEINKDNIHQRDLRIAAELLQLGSEVK